MTGISWITVIWSMGAAASLTLAVCGFRLGQKRVGREMLRASRLAQDLRASEARSLAILRAVPDLMFLQSLDGVYLDYHASRPDRLFVPPESFLGKNMREVLPPAVLSAVEPAFGKAVGGAETVVVEYEIPMPHGDRMYEARLVRNENDQILTLTRDVTESRRAQAALIESQQRYTLAQRRRRRRRLGLELRDQRALRGPGPEGDPGVRRPGDLHPARGLGIESPSAGPSGRRPPVSRRASMASPIPTKSSIGCCTRMAA